MENRLPRKIKKKFKKISKNHAAILKKAFLNIFLTNSCCIKVEMINGKMEIKECQLPPDYEKYSILEPI